VHNRYRSAQPSGENRVVEADIAALKSEGVEVFPYIRDSDEIEQFSAIRKAALAVRPLASPSDSIAFRRLLRTNRPHVVHLHNPYPLISPWIVRTAKAMDVPVVQTVHNYRHVCVNGIYFRDGHECTDCVGKRFPWPAVKNGCYRDSTLQSIPMAAALWAHRGTWQLVDRFLPVGEHVADHLRTFGIPVDRIVVRPNVVADPGEPKALGHGALYIGRLSEEKGIRLLLDAWRLSGMGAEHSLTIAGDGELRPLVDSAATADTSIRFLGLVPGDQVAALYHDAALVVVPSISQETDGLAAVVGMAAGRPILASDNTAMRRNVGPAAGWLVEPRSDRLAESLGVLADRPRLIETGRGARNQYLADRKETTSFAERAYAGLVASQP
jgi:glycosyltransferase involved in cell wall biosynthesis